MVGVARAGGCPRPRIVGLAHCGRVGHRSPAHLAAVAAVATATIAATTATVTAAATTATVTAAATREDVAGNGKERQSDAKNQLRKGAIHDEDPRCKVIVPATAGGLTCRLRVACARS